MIVLLICFLNIFSPTLQFSDEISNNSLSSYFPNEQIEYPINENNLCYVNTSHIIIAVHSSPNNFEKRNGIRNTFGSFKRVNNQLIQVAFFVGLSENETINKKLKIESDNFRDIIQANFIDSYRNLTLKHLSLYNWVNKYCKNAKYLIKVDDDTMVDIFHLEYFLRTHDLSSDFYCKVISAQVMRSGKWAVSKEDYPSEYYPPYCEGFNYILTNLKMLPEFINCSLKTKFFWIDDVLLLGNVRQKLNLTLDFFPDNFGYSNLHINSDTYAMDFVFFRNGVNEKGAVLWNNVWKSILQTSFDLYDNE